MDVAGHATVLNPTQEPQALFEEAETVSVISKSLRLCVSHSTSWLIN